MFVAMGLSAVFPVLQGIKLYGVVEAQQRIGLSWMLLQGLMYIAGAGLYAVGCHYAKKRSIPNLDRHVGQRESLQGRLISGEAHTKSFICWSLWQQRLICTVCLWPLITTTEYWSTHVENVTSDKCYPIR